MIIFPAIDLFGGKAVRLYKGDYTQMTVYSDHPEEIAVDFQKQGAEAIHIVDLEGAKDGSTPNFEVIRRIKAQSGLFCEIGGGIRSMDVIERYLSAGVDRVILGTAAIEDKTLLKAAVAQFGRQIAVGADLKNGNVAVKGWLETTDIDADSFFSEMQALGVETIICTDVSRDGAMRGTNLSLYQRLSQQYQMQITASGGVSSLEDVKALTQMKLYAAIIGKAYYEGALSLSEAIEVAKC